MVFIAVGEAYRHCINKGKPVDDGWSGTRWDRPGWQKLIEKVEADEVACICIKDSSRLGRDYLRVGLLREMLRERGIRLIAINEKTFF